jgi:uncharacterized small protein (DUF1192 family)
VKPRREPSSTRRRQAALFCALLFALGEAGAIENVPGKCFYTVCPIFDSSGRWIGQREIACDRQCPGSSLPRGGSRRWRDVADEVETASAAYEAARRNAEELARVLSGLSADQRIFAEGVLSAGERESVTAALAGLTRRLGGVVAANDELQRRVARLQSENARLSAELLRLQEQKRALLSSTTRISGQLAEIQAQIARLEAQLRETRADLEAAEDLAQGALEAAAAARREYWEGMGRFFDKHRLGAPRDYLERIEPAAPTTLRRTIRRTEVLFPQPLAPLAAPVAASAAPFIPFAVAAAADAPPGNDAERVRRDVVRLQAGMSRTERLQREALSLTDASRRSIEQLDTEARAVASLGAQERELRFQQQAAAERASRLAFELQGLAGAVRDNLDAGLRGLREQAYWEAASALLKGALARSNAPGVLHSYTLFMAQAWRDVLAVDAPKLIELMGPNPSDEALDALDRLRTLESRYTRELAMSMMFAHGGDEPPLRRQASYSVVKRTEKVRDFVSPSGARIPFTPLPPGSIPHWRAKGNSVLHIMEHSREVYERTLSESPAFGAHIAQKWAERGNPHSLFYGGGKETLAIIDDAWRLRLERRLKPVETGKNWEVFLVDMGRDIGTVPRGADPLGPSDPTRTVRLFVVGGDRLHAGYPFPDVTR